MSDDASAILDSIILCVDCADPPALAGWWRRVLGGTVEKDADGDARLNSAGGLTIDFLKVPEGKTVKNRLHIDLRSTDLAEATGQLLALGATTADDVYAGDRWQVMRDPEGNEFCILRPPSRS